VTRGNSKSEEPAASALQKSIAAVDMQDKLYAQDHWAVLLLLQ
jgi:hypothetical protein